MRYATFRGKTLALPHASLARAIYEALHVDHAHICDCRISALNFVPRLQGRTDSGLRGGQRKGASDLPDSGTLVVTKSVQQQTVGSGQERERKGGSDVLRIRQDMTRHIYPASVGVTR